MQCRNICEMLSLYIDGMLESSQAMQVEEHLAVCAACKSEYDDLRAAVELVRELPEVVLPREFHDELQQKLRSLPVPAVTAGQNSGMIRAPWIKRTKVMAAAAVIFLAVGYTTLWYDSKNEGGLFDIATWPGTGLNTAYRAESQGNGNINDGYASKAPERDANEMKATDDAVIGNNDSTDTDEIESSGSGVPVSNEWTGAGDSGAGNRPEPVIEDSGVTAVPGEDDSGTGAGDARVEKQAEPDFAVPEAQPSGEDAMFSIMAAPQEGAKDYAGQLEDNSLDIEKNLYLASEYTVTLVMDTGKIKEDHWSEVAGEYGGFVESKPQETGHYWVLRIPDGYMDEFVEKLNSIGRVEIRSRTRDLAGDMQQAQERLNMLWERESTLVEQQETNNNEDDTVISGELEELSGQIAREQQILADLQEDIVYARVDLYLKQP